MEAASWTEVLMLRNLRVPALALGVKIAPASSILVRHQGSWQAAQHGNHIVLNGASCIIGLQELRAVCHTKNSSVQSNEDVEAHAVPSCEQRGLDMEPLGHSHNPTH